MSFLALYEDRTLSKRLVADEEAGLRTDGLEGAIVVVTRGGVVSSGGGADAAAADTLSITGPFCYTFVHIHTHTKTRDVNKLSAFSTQLNIYDSTVNIPSSALDFHPHSPPVPSPSIVDHDILRSVSHHGVRDRRRQA